MGSMFMSIAIGCMAITPCVESVLVGSEGFGWLMAIALWIRGCGVPSLRGLARFVIDVDSTGGASGSCLYALNGLDRKPLPWMSSAPRWPVMTMLMVAPISDSI